MAGGGIEGNASTRVERFSKKENWLALVGSNSRAVNRNTWLCDSGASIRIVNDRSFFTSFYQTNTALTTCEDKTKLKITGQGTVVFQTTSSTGKELDLELSDVAVIFCLSHPSCARRTKQRSPTKRA